MRRGWCVAAVAAVAAAGSGCGGGGGGADPAQTPPEPMSVPVAGTARPVGFSGGGVVVVDATGVQRVKAAARTRLLRDRHVRAAAASDQRLAVAIGSAGSGGPFYGDLVGAHEESGGPGTPAVRILAGRPGADSVMCRTARRLAKACEKQRN